ncbi:SusC/RagA family TonB-linked outer membrane protein [Pedobacter sp. JCM 36344]|uniref:SusC/RagA family TonB-linked outer membrane protein n=1 Tax=Pedobacter sp. JCM 36344 TaxID=3374280 RepID=UPI00397A873A
MRKQIILLSIFFSCIFLCKDLMAQTKKITVRGTVTDAASNEPMVGAYVSSGVPLKVVATVNANGAYSAVVDEGATLTFSYVSYDPQTIKLKPGEAIKNVRLKETKNQLSEEVVIRGYVKRTRETTTGSSYIVSGKEVQDVPVGNVEQLLQGKVAGLNIQNNTGAPGMRGSTNIRGLSTISVTGTGESAYLQPTSPLYVIDGVPMDADKASEFGFDQQGPGVSPLSLIPQEDIASIEVLKDATATALYGSRGAYGVILIQTVRGKSEIPQVRYTSQYYVSTVPPLRPTYGGKAERDFKIAQIERYGQFEQKYRISNTPFLADSLNAFYNNSTDWQDIFYGNRFNTTHNVALDGGNEKFNYKTNVGYFSQSGIIENTGFERYSLSMNMEFKPSTRLRFFGQVRGSLGKVKSGSGTGVLQKVVDNSANRSSLLPGPSFLLATSDVLSTLQIRESSGPRNINAQMDASMSAGTTVNYDYVTETQDRFLPAAANSQFAQVYNFSGYGSTLYNRNNISYVKSINDSHNFFGNLFSELYVRNNQEEATRLERSPNDQFEGPLGYDGYFSRGGGVLQTFRDLKTVAIAAAFTYDYKKKYVVDLTYRLDGSSASGQLDPYSKNPSIGLKWNFNKENWFKNSKWLNYGDIRLTAGQNIYPNGSLTDIYGEYNPTGFYNNSPRVGINTFRIPNPYLKAKNVIQYNFGVDVGVFDGKLDVIFDTYYKKVDNELFTNVLSNTLGFSTYQSNGVALANYGYELALTSRPLSKESPLQWTISLNGAWNQDVLLRIPDQYNGQYINEINQDNILQFIALRTGRNSLSNYLFVNNGVYGSTSDVPVDPVTGLRMRNQDGGNYLNSYQGGDARFVDANGDYIIDRRDRQVSGNTQPLITGGFTNNFQYKQFGLNIFASFTAKRSVLNNALAKRLLLLSDPFNTNSIPPAGDLNIWKGPGDSNARYANAYNYAHEVYMNNFRYEQTLWQENGSYFKINQVTFSYSLDKKLVKRIGLNNIRTFVSSSNLVVFSPYSGPNPENVTSLGKDLSAGYPNPRTFTLGFNVTF